MKKDYRDKMVKGHRHLPWMRGCAKNCEACLILKERRRCARIAFDYVESMSEQEQLDFHPERLRNHILGLKS